MKSCGKEEYKCKRNGNGDRNCDGPAEFEKEHDKANKKEGEAEDENNRKRSKYKRDFWRPRECMWLRPRDSDPSLRVHVSSYPLEGDQRSRETEHAGEPEDIRADTDDCRFTPCD